MKIAVIGLGYVGLPLAVALGRNFHVVGYDMNAERVKKLASGIDENGELQSDYINSAGGLSFTALKTDLRDCTVYIICVPTPVYSNKSPDLMPIRNATADVAIHLKKGDLVIYESTVWPGCTEEICQPILERISGLTCNQDFSIGYSPERINPGDQEHTLETITKIISASNEEALQIMQTLYGAVCRAGLHTAPNIKTAEAAKCIENIQRDINIAFMNELKKLFDLMDIDTEEVLAAAGTKWNFLKFRPGLVGGHCIGVDPYYLAHKAKQIGFDAKIILTGRSINDSMAEYYANWIAWAVPADQTIAILGVTFKENVADIRNSKVFEVAARLKNHGREVVLIDPLANPKDVEKHYGEKLFPAKDFASYGAVVVAVRHDIFRRLDFSRAPKLFDLCGFFGTQKLDNLVT